MGAGDTRADTCPCSQAERSYLAEEKATSAHILGEFQSILPVSVWQWGSSGQDYRSMGVESAGSHGNMKSRERRPSKTFKVLPLARPHLLKAPQLLN